MVYTGAGGAAGSSALHVGLLGFRLAHDSPLSTGASMRPRLAGAQTSCLFESHRSPKRLRCDQEEGLKDAGCARALLRYDCLRGRVALAAKRHRSDPGACAAAFLPRGAWVDVGRCRWAASAPRGFR